jgi:hypothetical protein
MGMRAQTEGPPKPTPVISIGVSGHRLDKLDHSTIERLLPAIRLTLDTLLTELRIVTARSPECFGGAAKLRILSAAAEGADRILAQEGLAIGSDLQLVLPFGRDEYARDFSDESSRHEYRDLLQQASAIVELDGDRPCETEAYLAAGELIVEHCDVLIALWDGHPAAGEGGTAEIVRLATKSGRAVVWLNTEFDHPAVVRLKGERDNNEAGAIRSLGQRLAADFVPPDDKDVLCDRPARLRELLQPPRSSLLRAYLSERHRRWTGGGFFAALRNLVNGNPSWPRLRLAPWGATTGFDEPTAQGIATREEAAALRRLNAQYGWADGLSVYYGDLYRSGYSANYLLAASSVVFALLGIPLPFVEPVSVVLEFACIAGILFITLRGSRRRWHARWIAYRQLAEQLRALRFLVLLCSRPTVPEMPKHLARSDKETAWVSWLYGAILRDIGLPTAKVDNAYLARARDGIARSEVKAQADYHRDSGERLHRFDHRLHVWGVGLFFITAAACVFHVVEHCFPIRAIDASITADVLTFVSGALPAIGGAFLAIRNQGEFAEMAKQSERMSAVFDEFYKALLRPDYPPVSRKALAEEAKQLAEIMLVETGYWHVVFLGKPLGWPG